MDYVKQLVVPKEVVKASFEGQKAINLTLMTFDKNVHKVIVPVLPQKVTPLMMYDIDKVLVFIWYDNNEKIIQINGEIENENVTFILPDELRGYPGIFYMEVDLVLTDDRTMTLAQFRAETKASNADMIPENVIKEAKEWYFQLFEDWAGDVGSAKEDAEKDWLEWKKQREQDWKTFENNFTNWKDEQAEARTAYETDETKKRDDWEKAQEKKQTDHESAFTTWKTAQEKKQTDFESSVNTKHTAINKEIDDINKTIEGINTDFDNLDAYSKAETDAKLKGKASATDLNKKADKTEVDKKANQADLKKVTDELPTFAKKGTRTFLTPADGFENFHDESVEANKSVLLQYIIQGNVGLLFGTVKNTEDWPKNAGNKVFARFPDNIKITTGLTTSAVGVNTTKATVKVLSHMDGANPNCATIAKVQNENGLIEAEKGTRFDIFAAFLVE